MGSPCRETSQAGNFVAAARRGLDRFTGDTKEAKRCTSAVKKQNEHQAHVQVIRVPCFDKLRGQMPRNKHDVGQSTRSGDNTCLPLKLKCLRSEEHTSELQSLRHLVCRLLLEKKN